MTDDERGGPVPRSPEPDVVVFGGSPPRESPRRGRLRWLGRPRWLGRLGWLGWLALPVAIGGAVVLAVLTHAGPRAAPQAQRGSPSPSSAPAATAPAPAAQPSSPPDVTVTTVGRPLIGVTAGWELFGWGPEGVVRVELARGRITRTAMPPIASTGPTSFLVGRDWAMVRPLDGVPGYLVRDGRPARALGGALSRYGPALPGPDPQHVWAPAGSARYDLVDAEGDPAGPSIAVPATLNGFAQPDGAGYVLFPAVGGVYDAHPDGLRRVTTGAVLAAGPTRLLIYECDKRHRCETVVIDRGTGARHSIPVAVAPAYDPGVISPTGTAAALVTTDATNESAPGSVHLIRLRSGPDRRLAIPVGNDVQDGTMAWSPDGHWLFVAARGELYTVDADTGEVGDLGVRLPPLTQIAVRP